MTLFINDCCILGLSGSKAQVEFTKKQTPILKLAILTRDKRNDEVENMWHRVIVFGEIARTLAPRIKKGSVVLVQGKMTNRTYTDSQGTQKVSSEIIARNIKISEPESPMETQQDFGLRFDQDN